MGKFVDLIRKKLGLEPERKLTVTGNIPNKVVVNRNVMREQGGYPVPVIPTVGARDKQGKKTSLAPDVPAHLVSPDEAGDVGLDSSLINDKNVELERRKNLKRQYQNGIIEGIDEPKPMGSYGTFTTTPVPPVKLKTKRVKAEGLFAADIASGDTGEAGNPNQSMDQLNGPTHPIDPKFVKKKVMKEKTEQLNELSPETLASYKEKAVESAKAADARGDFALGHKRFKGVVQATKKQFKKDLEPKNEEVSLREHVQSIISEAKKYYTVPTDTPIIFGRNHPDPEAREHSKKWHEIQREMNRNAGMSNTQLKNNPNAPYEYARLAAEADHHQKEFNKRMQELKGLSEAKGRGADSKGLYRPTEQGAGLTRKGAKHYGVKTAVTTPPSKLDPDGEAAGRRKSFCARMGGMPGPMKDEKGRPTRKAMSLRRWNCEANEVLMTLVEAKKMKGDPCWDNYEMVGMKMKNGRKVPDCRGPIKESVEHPAVVKFASIQHENWRKGFDPTGQKERIKKNSDGTEGNINVPFEKLHPDWQRENLEAGKAALNAINLHGNDTEKAAEHVHNEWMKRNPKGDWNKDQHVPYSQLPENEKQKDRDHVTTMRSLLNAGEK